MDAITRAVYGFFDVLYLPFGGNHAFWALFVMSAVTGVVMLFVFKYTTNQEQMRIVKDRIKMHFIELRLYQDDMKVLFNIQGRILMQNLRYVRLVIIAALLIIVPVVFILMDMDLRFGHRPLAVGETALVKVALAGRGALPEVDLVTPEGVVVEAPKVRMPVDREIDWRLHATRAGVYDLLFRVNGREVVKKLFVGDSFAYLGKDPGYDGATVASIDVTYPLRRFGLDNWIGHWLTLFCVFSVAIGFGLKPVFHVE